MIYLKGAMALLSATGLIGKLIAGGVLIASLLTLYGAWHHKVYKEGWNAHLAGVVRADEKVVAHATKLRGVLLSCEARNLEWDQTTGGCK